MIGISTMISAIEIALAASLVGNAASVPMSLIAPVAGLSPVNLASALGAFIWAVTGLVFAVFVDRRQHPHLQHRSAREI